MAEINDLNIADASNTARFPENMAPSAVNDGARALEGLIARWHEDTNGSVASTGSANAYLFAAKQTLSAYYDGLTISFDANFGNTGAATLNVDSVSADAIVWPDGTALASGDIPADAKVTVRHDGVSWQLVSATRALSSGASAPFLDENDMSSDSATSVASQQSIVAYIAAQIAALVTGKLLQTQITVDTTNRSTTSTSYAASGVSVSITPVSTSNKVRIRVHAMVGHSTIGGKVFLTLKRGATDLTPSGVNSFTAARIGEGFDIENVTFEFEDSPSSTSALSYEIYWKVAAGTGRLGRRHSDTDFDCPTIIVVEEIAA